MRRTPFALTASVLAFAIAATGVPVSDLYAYAVADAGEETTAEPYSAEVTPEPSDVIIEGEGEFICYDCRVRFVTEAEYIEHIKTDHPGKWEAMKSDYEGWFEEYEPKTESSFKLNPYLKFALVGGAFAAAFIIIRLQGTLEPTE